MRVSCYLTAIGLWLMASGWRVIARNRRWVGGATITESVNADDGRRRFTATIRGWRGWRLWEGPAGQQELPQIIERAREIRDRIDAGDESVFQKGEGNV